MSKDAEDGVSFMAQTRLCVEDRGVMGADGVSQSQEKSVGMIERCGHGLTRYLKMKK